jgi:hypothetical protein
VKRGSLFLDTQSPFSLYISRIQKQVPGMDAMIEMDFNRIASFRPSDNAIGRIK